MVAELNARMPEEGGLYLWTRSAFGEVHGYVVAWCYWLCNIVWFPTVLLLISVSALYLFGSQFLYLSESLAFNAVICLAVLWIVTGLNIVGLERARWIQNIGATAVWLTIGLLIVSGLLLSPGTAAVRPFTPDSLLPDLSDHHLLPYFAIIAFCFGGLELAPVMAGEVREPRRNIPRALVISAGAAGLLYMSGTLVLIMTVPQGEVGIIEGVAQTFHALASSAGMPWLGVVGVLLVLLGSIGLFGAWMTGTARLPFVIGLHHYLPEQLARIHPRWRSPYVSLLMQGGVVTVLFLWSIAGATVKDAFLVLLDMSVVLYFIPFLYMFAALVVHQRRNTGGRGMIGIFERSGSWVWIVAVSGFSVTLLATVLSCLPSGDVVDKEWFLVKVVGGATVLIGVGMVLFFLRKRKPN